MYEIIAVQVTDADAYAEYMARVPATVEQYGGRYVVRTSDVVPLAGDWTPERVIVSEFDSAETVSQWNESPEYRVIAPLRLRGARTRAIRVEGCA